ncbi:hypothetical protein BRC90_08165 [Halobacteriales archaeon QS_4_69_34]|nr:MAG: hypothetical protein BRC90_08165 [Halobacteriales archaeon QS_4_69_34]
MDADWQETRAELGVELGLLQYRPVDWVLLSGSRLAVSAGLLAIVAAIMGAIVTAGMAPLTERTPILFLLFALIGGNFTLITIVVSISQFVLTRHLESPGEVREGLREMIGYRQEVGEATREKVVPVTPSRLFVLLFRSIDRELEALRNAGWSPPDPELRRDVERLVADLEGHAARVIGLVEGSDAGIRYALLAVLDTDYSRYFVGAYRVRAAFGEDLPASVADALDRIERHVEQVDVARRYFKTVFIQSELASLSRLLLYIGLPVQVASVVLMLLFTAPADPILARPVLRIVIPLVVTAGFAPIVLLTAYILRLATVVERTAAMYPFTTRPGR